jgi:hypothetical protein
MANGKQPRNGAGPPAQPNARELPSPPDGSRIWFENAKSNHDHGGPGWKFGTCLWSPSKDKGGGDWYWAMREVRKGDLVINVCDNYFHGISFAAGAATERNDEPPNPDPWAGMAPYYRVELEGFIRFENPPPIGDLLKRHRGAIAEELEAIKSHTHAGEFTRPPFQFVDKKKKDRLGFAQTYLTRSSVGLYNILRGWAQGGLHRRILPSLPRTRAVDGQPRPPVSNEPRFWAISLGEGGRLWNKCQEEGVAAIGWDELGDLRNYPDHRSVAQALRAQRGPNGAEPINDSLACYEFAHAMRPGDYVIAKIGRRKLLGVGIVKGEYQYDQMRSEYHNVRKVDWLRTTDLELPDDATIPLKTLTDVTSYKAFISFITENLIDVSDIPAGQSKGEPFGSVENCYA